MIYLIGGSPRGGKSILAHMISQKLDIPYLSTDDIRPIVMAYFSETDLKEKFPFGADDMPTDDYFNTWTGEDMLKAEIIEAHSSWAGVKNLINHLRSGKMDYVIEGVYLLPELVKEFSGDADIKIVFLVKEDAEKIFQGLMKNKGENDWIATYVTNDEMMMTAAKALSVYGPYFADESKKYGFKCVNTENNFHNKLENTFKTLTVGN